jgi:hypothetical protein
MKGERSALERTLQITTTVAADIKCRSWLLVLMQALCYRRLLALCSLSPIFQLLHSPPQYMKYELLFQIVHG